MSFLTAGFMQHALIAGSGIAVAAGLTGYFLVLRLQVFASDALGHVAYTGALGALAYGADPRVGLFVATVAVGLALAALGRGGRPDDVVIGSTFAWVLGLGAFFLSVYATSASTANGNASVTYLFGSIYGLSSAQAWVAAAIGGGAAVLVVVVARPLLFASLDGAVAAARGVRVGLLGAIFLILVGVSAAEASQAVGSLLILGLIAGPGGAAHRLTARPYRGMALASALALASLWLGLAFAYLVPKVPPSFGVIAVATGTYALALAVTSPVFARSHVAG